MYNCCYLCENKISLSKIQRFFYSLYQCTDYSNIYDTLNSRLEIEDGKYNYVKTVQRVVTFHTCAKKVSEVIS